MNDITLLPPADLDANRIDQYQSIDFARTGYREFGRDPAAEGQPDNSDPLGGNGIKHIQVEIHQIVHRIKIIRPFGCTESGMGRCDHFPMFGQAIHKRRKRTDRIDPMDQQDRCALPAAQDLKLQPPGAKRRHSAAARCAASSSIGSRSCSCGNTSLAASEKLFIASAWVTRPWRVIMMIRPTPPTRWRNSLIWRTTVSGLPQNIWPWRIRLSTERSVGRFDAPARQAVGVISGAI